jgi:hypothetical protein
MATASARTPPGSGTPACNCHPTDGPPIASSRVASASLPSGGEPRPPAHTTTWPSDHDACRTTSSGSHTSEVKPEVLVGDSRAGGGRRWRRTKPGRGRLQTVERVGEVGDDLIAFLALQVPDRGQIFLGIEDQPVEQKERLPFVGAQHRQLFIRSPSFGDRPDCRFQLLCIEHQSLVLRRSAVWLVCRACMPYPCASSLQGRRPFAPC